MSIKRKSSEPRSLYEILEGKFGKEGYRESSTAEGTHVAESDFRKNKEKRLHVPKENCGDESYRSLTQQHVPSSPRNEHFSLSQQKFMETVNSNATYIDLSGAADTVLDKNFSRSLALGLVASNNIACTASETIFASSIDPRFGFCCHRCKCSQESRDKFLAHSVSEGDLKPNVLVPELPAVWHRRCCHGVTHKDRWLPPFEAAIERFLQKKVLDGRKRCRKYSTHEVSKLFDKSERLEKELFHDDFSVDPFSQLQTNPDYVKIVEKFRGHLDQLPASREQGCVVMEIFGGIGSGTIALKRLGIGIKKIIYVEYDEVAMHVFRHNHDSNYNFALSSDDIDYIFYRRFEDVFENFEEIMSHHGPFDLILSGPPCVDYSPVNARRQGFEGDSGNLMIQVGLLVDRIKSHPLQLGQPVYFLVENVVLRGEDLDQACLAFGITPLLIDSSCFSPCKRKRMYWVNFALHNVHFNAEESALIMPSSCLDGNYHLPGTLLDKPMRVKSNTFMASKGRLDDHRMMVFRTDINDPSAYNGRPVYVEERGRMMGFPEGYVTSAIEPLFNALSSALSFNYPNRGLSWIDDPDVPEKLLHFSGERFRFDISGLDEQRVTNLQIARPDSDEYFCKIMYGKRLYGNAWSIPTVEKLLEPLKALFTSKSYGGYPYRYAFESESALSL